jgi:uncharacterized protein (TIGR02147 family)
MDKADIFKEIDYRNYIEKKLKTKGYGRGSKAKLADLLDCQPSFISQVLKDKNTFSLEQAYKINSFFKHDNLEQDYFITLVEYDRAGTFDLKQYFEIKLKEISKKAQLLENRVKRDELSETDAMLYFSNWNHVLIRRHVDIPKYQNKRALKEKLNLTEEEITKALDFLLEKKLVVLTDNKFTVGPQKIHIKKGSPLAQFASIKGRLKNIERLNIESEDDFNFTAEISLSSKNYREFKNELTHTVSNFIKRLDDDNAEKVCSLTIDLMEF